MPSIGVWLIVASLSLALPCAVASHDAAAWVEARHDAAGTLRVAPSSLRTKLKEPIHDPTSAVQGLITRLLGAQYVSQFAYAVLPKDTVSGHDVFELSTVKQNGTSLVRLGGSSGTAMASALHWYLRYYCNAQVTWGFNGTGSQLKLPSPLPAVSGLIRRVKVVPYTYMLNVCTVSYTMAFWNWSRWEFMMDWAALHGVNLPLSFTGQEYVWYELFSQVGLNDTEIQNYFSGAAFLAWFRMGNIQGWAGPLSADWREGQKNMQLQILQRSREFGMISVLPGFAGHVPGAVQRIYPNAKLLRSAPWAGFNATYSEDYMIDPSDPLFGTMADTFYSILLQTYGTDHVYNADLFNEMPPPSSNASYLEATNVVVYQAMQRADPDAVYLMQGWLFHESFWTNANIEAYLRGVPDDAMIILDLNTEATPVWSYTNSYFGKPWIWNLLHNYGGNRGLYGNLTEIGSQPLIDKATAGQNMVGIGITPEAIEQNPPVYELMMEMAWHDTAVDPSQWLQQYALSRYGSNSPLAQQAWQTLYAATYDQECLDNAILEHRPGVTNQAPRCANQTLLVAAWKNLVAAAVQGQVDATVGPYRYDVVDLSRQVLVNYFDDVHNLFKTAYLRFMNGNLNTTTRVLPALNKMMEIIGDLDGILSTDINFMLGLWQSEAKSWAQSPQEAANLEFNARNQITLWGDRGEINDYAAKQWQGLVGDYYKRRWNLFSTYATKAVTSGHQADWNQFSSDALALEQGWNQETKAYPSAPTADTMKVATALLQKYTVSTSDYTVMPGMDINSGDLTRAWTNDIAQLKMLCDLDNTCVGFNQNGYLKNGTHIIKSAEYSILYLKPSAKIGLDVM